MQIDNNRLCSVYVGFLPHTYPHQNFTYIWFNKFVQVDFPECKYVVQFEFKRKKRIIIGPF